MKECKPLKHNFINSGYGSDLICTKCGYAAKQAALPIGVEIRAEIAVPIVREKIEVPVFNGEKTVRVERYKDDVMKEFRKSVGLGISVSNNGL